MAEVHFDLGSVTANPENAKEFVAMQGASAITPTFLEHRAGNFFKDEGVIDYEKLKEFIAAAKAGLLA